MVRIFKGSVGLGGGEEPACEPPLSGKDYIKNFNHLMGEKDEKGNTFRIYYQYLSMGFLLDI